MKVFDTRFELAGFLAAAAVLLLLIPGLNAFVPEGTNRVFRPVAVFGQSISNYSLQVYGRYGDLIFESNDWQIGWEGFHGNSGEELPQGVYTYVARWTKADGTIDESFGTVVLLR